MDRDREYPLPLPDKKIPASVMIIGAFEIAIALLGAMFLALVAQLEVRSAALFILLIIYGAMGTGLLAIQEWARRANVALHLVAVPYAFYTLLFLGGTPGWQFVTQLIISFAIVRSLTRPAIKYKFGTVVPKQKKP